MNLKIQLNTDITAPRPGQKNQNMVLFLSVNYLRGCLTLGEAILASLEGINHGGVSLDTYHVGPP